MGLFDKGKLKYSESEHFLLSLHIPQIHVNCPGVEIGLVRWPEVA